MLRSTLIIVQVAGLAAAVLCLEAARTDRRKPNPLETPLTITATILRLEDSLDENESHHRVAIVNELIADDYWGITVGGGIITKRDVLAAVGGSEEASSQSSDREVRPLQNAAVLHSFRVGPGHRPENAKTVYGSDSGDGHLAETRRRMEVGQRPSYWCDS